MIVVGVDVHKQSLTAVAVDEVGRPVAEQTVGHAQVLLEWAVSLAGERLWALEDCRQLTRTLERALIGAGEQLVRVPPKLMAPQRRAGRVRGESDRSMRSPSPGPLCGSHVSITRVRVSSGCVS